MPGPVIVAILFAPEAGWKYSQGDAICVLPEGQGPGSRIEPNLEEKYAFIEVTDAGSGQAGVDAVVATGILEPRYAVSIDSDTGLDEGGDLVHTRRKGNPSVSGWPQGQVNKAKDWSRKFQVTLAQVVGYLVEKA